MEETYCWLLEDIYSFENVTFTRSVDGKMKYLACADCEHGPIGYQDLETQYCYVGINRVRYKSS